MLKLAEENDLFPIIEANSQRQQLVLNDYFWSALWGRGNAKVNTTKSSFSRGVLSQEGGGDLDIVIQCEELHTGDKKHKARWPEEQRIDYSIVRARRPWEFLCPEQQKFIPSANKAKHEEQK